MTPGHAAMAGLSADYGCEAARFVRLSNMACRDSAVFRRMVKDWSLKMEGLFLAGRVLEEPPSQREAQRGVGGHSLASATFLAVSNSMQAPPLQFGQKVHYFWGPSGKQQVLDVLESLQLVCKVSLQRLSTEF